MDRALRRLEIAPAFLILLLIGLLLLAVAAAVLVGIAPPRPGPLIALPELSQPPPASPAPLPEAARVAELEFQGPDFYALPQPLPAGRAGTLVYLERLGPTTYGRAYRVLYRSRSVHDRDVAVSGTIWIPAAPPPPGGYPIVSFGMDNDGSGDMCAMSRADVPSIDGSWGGLMTLLLHEGYVVAFADYEGWGTSDPYPFAVLDSSAHAVLDAARAARDLLGGVASDRVVLMGYGLGADAAAAAGERASVYAPDLDVRGVIAADGGGGDYEAAVRDFVAAGAKSGHPTAILQGIAGFSVAYPELRPEDVLTPLGLEDIRDVETMCWYTFDGLVSNAVGSGRGGRQPTRRAPMGPADQVDAGHRAALADVPGGDRRSGTGRRHASGGRTVLSRQRCGPAPRIPRGDGRPARQWRHPQCGVYVVSWPDERQWLADRFAGVPPIGNCDR